MSKNENKMNKINSQIFNENEGFKDNNFLETSQNQSRNKKNEKNKKENNSQISIQKILQRIFTIDEENVLVKIIENHNNSSISKIWEFFHHSNLNYSKFIVKHYIIIMKIILYIIISSKTIIEELVLFLKN